MEESMVFDKSESQTGGIRIENLTNLEEVARALPVELNVDVGLLNCVRRVGRAD
jgi:hypothetical protein